MVVLLLQRMAAVFEAKSLDFTTIISCCLLVSYVNNFKSTPLSLPCLGHCNVVNQLQGEYGTIFCDVVMLTINLQSIKCTPSAHSS